MWSTLIIMEVIPFLVLAVGVDNMFVLAHALGRQVGAALTVATTVFQQLGAICLQCLQYANMPLIPMEVVAFLVLVVGVDSICAGTCPGVIGRR
jgi:hypothetical protein